MSTLIELDDYEMTRNLDKAKSKLFSGNNAAFFGSLLCSLDFIWVEDIPTACTDGAHLMWNPHWFNWLKPMTRVTVLMHEIWHVARLHIVTRGGRDPLIWNYACDIWINNQLESEGYSFEGVEDCWKDPHYIGWVEEDIYDDLIKSGRVPPPLGTWGLGDSDLEEEASQEDMQNTVNSVVRAVHQHKASGAGTLPGNTEIRVTRFLEPVVPWETVLLGFFHDLLEDGRTWARPNRRYTSMYLPSSFTDDGRLEHLCYYLDVSGSITRKDVIRFNSEVKHIWDVFRPQKLSLVLFDTDIRKVVEFSGDDQFDEVQVVAGGGTSFVCVREHMMKVQPTAAIIFTDLDCAPMQPLEHDIPTIWVATNGSRRSVPFGKLIHLRK
uniref:Metalloprotease n=1 Tax=Pseudomonas phage Arace01 TaxID=3138526 RepID=A0AAU6W0S2_9VIRU